MFDEVESIKLNLYIQKLTAYEHLKLSSLNDNLIYLLCVV